MNSTKYLLVAIIITIIIPLYLNAETKLNSFDALFFIHKEYIISSFPEYLGGGGGVRK